MVSVKSVGGLCGVSWEGGDWWVELVVSVGKVGGVSVSSGTVYKLGEN